jgi:hypothetical protein
VLLQLLCQSSPSGGKIASLRSVQSGFLLFQGLSEEAFPGAQAQLQDNCKCLRCTSEGTEAC